MCVQNDATSLHIASQQGHWEVVKVLLEANADLSIQSIVSHVDGVCVIAQLCSWVFTITFYNKCSNYMYTEQPDGSLQCQ